MESLVIEDSYITDIFVVASMPLLVEFVFLKEDESPSIKDLSPLSFCPLLEDLFLNGNREIKDLSPLSFCKMIENISICECLITSLAPLSTLQHLESLTCYMIDPETSLLPLASCAGLEELHCCEDAVDLAELKIKRSDLNVNLDTESDGDIDSYI